MGQLSENSKRMLLECGCDCLEADQVAALCACGCTDEAIMRVRRRRAELMDDLHERQARVDKLDYIVREIKKNNL